MTELARCPCGKIPSFLVVDGDTDRPKWARCGGNCCSEWWIEYRNNYHELDSDEAATLAEKAWNEAPRGTDDFYAVITPDSVLTAAEQCPEDARKIAHMMCSPTHPEWSWIGLLTTTAGLLHMLEQAERRAGDLQAELSAVYELLPESIYMDPPDGGDVSPLEQMRRMADDAASYRSGL